MLECFLDRIDLYKRDYNIKCYWFIYILLFYFQKYYTL